MVRATLLSTSYGVRGSTERWIESWITNRRQQVVVDTRWWCIRTGPSNIRGTSRNSTWTTYVFNIYKWHRWQIGWRYKNQTFCRRLSTLQKHKIHSDQDQLQRDLNNVVEWSIKWQMKFAPAKCHTIQLHVTQGRSTNIYTC